MRQLELLLPFLHITSELLSRHAHTVSNAQALQQAKTAFPNAVLIVGCCSDPLTHALKGQTVLQDEERYSSLRHCRHVDELIENAPWVLNDEFLDEHDIDFVAHDALPYTDSSGSAGDSGDIYAHIKQQGRFLETKRTTGVSTTELIVRIIKRYDDFISRNVKRGYSLDDMDVPLLNRVNHAASAAIDAAAAVVRTAGKNAQILQKRLQDRLEKNAAEFQERFVKVFEPLQQRERNQHAKAAGRMATPSPTGAGAAAAGAAGGSESSDSAGDLPEADIVAVSPRGRKLARKR